MASDVFRERWVTVDDCNVHYVELGAGDPTLPTVIALHGFMSDSQSIMPLVGQLQYKGRVIIPDLPGFGQSEACHHDDVATIDIYVEWLRKFLKSVTKKNERIIPLGYSFGAYVSQMYLTECTDREIARVQGSILLCPVTRIQSPAHLYTAGFLKLADVSEQLAARAWRSQHDFTTMYLSKSPQLRVKIGLVRYRRREITFFNPQLVRDLFTCIRSLEVEKYFGKDRVPTWVIFAEKDNLASNASVKEMTRQYIHGGQVREIENAGHLVPIEDTEKVVPYVNEALDNIVPTSNDALRDIAIQN